MLTLTLRKPLARGAERQLTPSECAEILACGSSVRPRYSKNWRIIRDDDGNLQIWWTTKANGASWAVEEKLPVNSPGVVAIALSSPIAVGESRSLEIDELRAVFDCGVSLMPGAQLIRVDAKFLRLVCGKSQWMVQEVRLNTCPARRHLGRIDLSRSSLNVLGHMF